MRADHPALSRGREQLARYAPAKLAAFATSLIELALVPAALRRFGLAPVQAALVRSRLVGRGVPSYGPDDRVLEIARLVDRAARRAPSDVNCLARAVVLWGALRRRGFPAELRIGVAPAAPRADIHAWVECRGTVLNDRPDVERHYVAFARPIGPPSGH